MNILTGEGKQIKHLRPSRYRRLKKDLHLYGVPKGCKIIVQLYFYDGDNLFADVWFLQNNEMKFYDTIQSF